MNPQTAARFSENINWDEDARLAQEILGAVLALRNLLPGDGEKSGKLESTEHLMKIRSFVQARQAIEFVLPAFPAKSSNREKTIGALPDFGEVLALRRLNELCADIGRVYAPGARVIICSDGRVFSDLVQVSDKDVSRYGAAIKKIINEESFSQISTFDLDDVFLGQTDHDRRRANLIELHGETRERVRERTLDDFEFSQLFNGIHRFLFEDFLILMPQLTRNKIRKLSKEMAYGVVQRSQAWSNLVREKFPDAVRLSIHPQTVYSGKIGVQLVPSSNIWRTPWHSVVLFDGTRYRLTTRKEAESMGATLFNVDGKYACYFIREKRGGAYDYKFKSQHV